MRVRKAFVHIVEAVEDEDEGDTVLPQNIDVFFYGFLIAEGKAAEGMLERLFIVAVESQVEVVGCVDADDCVFQKL